MRRSGTRTDLESNGDEIVDEAPARAANRRKKLERGEKRRPNAGASSDIDRPAMRTRYKRSDEERKPRRGSGELRVSRVSKIPARFAISLTGAAIQPVAERLMDTLVHRV